MVTAGRLSWCGDCLRLLYNAREPFFNQKDLITCQRIHMGGNMGQAECPEIVDEVFRL